jgi:hypothetical protein
MSTEKEKVKRLASGFRLLDEENKEYLKELSRKLLYAQSPSVGSAYPDRLSVVQSAQEGMRQD